MHIRRAERKDASRIAEILVFGNRVNFYPIFREDEYSFGELQVVPMAKKYEEDELLSRTFVYDDGIVRGVIQVKGDEVEKLYVDSFFTGRGIGGQLIEYAKEKLGVTWLWALEKNVDAIRFYERHGFRLTGEKVFEEGTEEYLVKMELETEQFRIERRSADDEEILRLFSLHDDFMIDFLGEDRVYYTRYGEHEKLAAVWAAVINGQAVGCAAYRMKETSVGEVKRVFVQPDYRGRGLSKALLSAVEEHARKEECDKLFLDTRITLEPAVTLYRKAGFEIVFRQGLYVQMEKRI